MDAPLSGILPSLVPLALEQALEGYGKMDFDNIDERKLSNIEIRPVMAAATYIGALNYAVSQGFEWEHVVDIFDCSISEVKGLSSEELDDTLILVEQFLGYKIIRENHAFDDWICESWWENYQTIKYEYPSELSHAISYCLGMKNILMKCDLIDT